MSHSAWLLWRPSCNRCRRTLRTAASAAGICCLILAASTLLALLSAGPGAADLERFRTWC
jgi:hypothetical protein